MDRTFDLDEGTSSSQLQKKSSNVHSDEEQRGSAFGQVEERDNRIY